MEKEAIKRLQYINSRFSSKLCDVATYQKRLSEWEYYIWNGKSHLPLATEDPEAQEVDDVLRRYIAELIQLLCQYPHCEVIRLSDRVAMALRAQSLSDAIDRRVVRTFENFMDTSGSGYGMIHKSDLERLEIENNWFGLFYRAGLWLLKRGEIGHPQSVVLNFCRKMQERLDLYADYLKEMKEAAAKGRTTKPLPPQKYFRELRRLSWLKSDDDSGEALMSIDFN